MGELTEKAKGLTNEAIGNTKQAIGKATDNERLRAEGELQERKGGCRARLATRSDRPPRPSANKNPRDRSRGLFVGLRMRRYLPPDATRSTSVIPPSVRMNRT